MYLLKFVPAYTYKAKLYNKSLKSIDFWRQISKKVQLCNNNALIVQGLAVISVFHMYQVP